MRTIERYDGPMIEKELRFKDWCKTREIAFVGFDADDTLWETAPIFSRQMDACYDFLEKEAPILSRSEWKKRIEYINNQAFEKIGVNPKRWRFVADNAIGTVGVSEAVKTKAEEILMKIYDTPPKLLTNTLQTLEFIKKCGLGFGKITHANVAWDVKKGKWTGTAKYFNDDNTYRIDEDGHKTVESWEKALRFFRVNPINCVIVGDSPRADIYPAEQLGVRERILVDDPKTQRWAVHELKVSDQTIVVANIGEMIYLRN